MVALHRLNVMLHVHCLPCCSSSSYLFKSYIKLFCSSPTFLRSLRHSQDTHYIVRRNSYSLLILVHALCYRPSYRNCFQLAIFKSVVVKILLQRGKLMITAKPPDNNHNCCAFFGYEMIRHVNLFSDRHSHVSPQPG